MLHKINLVKTYDQNGAFKFTYFEIGPKPKRPSMLAGTIKTINFQIYSSMIQDKILTITKRHVFISYKYCQLFQDVADVPVSIPELPIPGNLFEGEYFLPDIKRQVFSRMNHLFFVKDLTHRFTTGAQHIIIVLAIAPRNPMTAVRSTKN